MARESVEANYTDFTTKFEGKLPFMYLDVKGLVTTGIGNLIDPIGAALSLPWVHTNGAPASQDEIRSAWNAVKARQDMKLRGGGAFAGVTDLRLTDDGIRQLVNDKLRANEAILRKRFPTYDNWPADAQLGLLSMAWAMGPNFRYPKFEAAVNALVPDFAAAAKESYINDANNPGLRPRNVANESLFMAAADTLKNNLDVTAINWSGFDDLMRKGVAAVSSAAQTGAKTYVKTQRKLLVPGLSILGLSAIAYGAYEYRDDIQRGVKRAVKRVKGS